MIALASTEPGVEEEDNCRRLIAAVLQRAIADVVQYHAYKGSRERVEFRSIYVQAEDWIFRDDTAAYDVNGVTFPEACAILGRDYRAVRSMVARLMEGRSPPGARDAALQP